MATVRLRYLFLVGVATMSISFFVYPQVTGSANLDQQITGQIDAGAWHAGYGAAADPRQALAEIIQIALGAVGSIFIVLMAMSGYWYITARGEESKIEKATKTARGAVVGVILVLLAYSITIFVSQKSQQALKAPQSGESRCKWYSLWFCSAIE